DADIVVGRQRRLASGVIIDPDGYIITNAHVVNGGQRIEIILPGNVAQRSPLGSLVQTRERIVEARTIGIAPEVDLALLKIDGDHLPFLRLADYDALHQGELVFAFGSPEGL